METNSIEEHLEQIDAFVMDEGKRVTYKWLCKALEIHVNSAKQLLFMYMQQKKRSAKVTYAIGGVLLDGSGSKFVIVRESELESFRKQFKYVTSEHVYSVQKDEVRDLNILLDSGLDSVWKIVTPGQGAIKCTNAVQRVANDMANLRLATFKPAAGAKLLPAQKKTIADPPKVAETSKADELISDTKTKATAVPEKPKTIASMFSNQSKKNTTSNKTPVSAAKNSKAGITSFFNKLPEKPKMEEPAQIDDQTEDKQHSDKKALSCEEPMTQPAEEKPVNKVNGVAKPTKTSTTSIVKKKIESEASSSKNSSANGKRKKKGTSGRVEKPAKKRKRIMVMSDSDASDDDIFGKDESSDEELRPPSPDILPEDVNHKSQSSDEDIIPATPVVQTVTNGKRRSRIRKMVDKTSVDDDGFITTKKEYVFESCSEDENVQEVKEPVKAVQQVEIVADDDDVNSPPDEPTKKKKKAAKKKEPPAAVPKPKQQSIMSFFKKN